MKIRTLHACLAAAPRVSAHRMALATLAVGSACGALAQGAPATGELLAQNLRAPSLAETVVAATRTPQPLADGGHPEVAAAIENHPEAAARRRIVL